MVTGGRDGATAAEGCLKLPTLRPAAIGSPNFRGSSSRMVCKFIPILERSRSVRVGPGPW
jgi:hypothetical protein